MIELERRYGLIILYSKHRLKLATPFSLVYEVEVVFPLKYQIPSLKIVIQEGLSNEDNVRLHLKELEALDEKCLEAQQQLECYQA